MQLTRLVGCQRFLKIFLQIYFFRWHFLCKFTIMVKKRIFMQNPQFLRQCENLMKFFLLQKKEVRPMPHLLLFVAIR